MAPEAVADGYRRWLYVLATESYRPDSELFDLNLTDEIRDVRAAFDLLGYPRADHVMTSAVDEGSAVAALRAWVRTKGPTDIVAIYVTGHGEVFTVNGVASLGLHTEASRAGNDAETIAPEQLLKGFRSPQAPNRVRNLLLVLDVCGAGAGLMESLGAVRRSVQILQEQPGTSLGAHVIATTRGTDRARPRSFAAAWWKAVSDPEVAPRSQPYLELATLLGAVQDNLPRQVLDPASLGGKGPNLCLANPRHHLAGIDPVDLDAWWEPRARGAPPAPDHASARVPSARRWLFTGRHRVNQRLSGWLADPGDASVLVLTAGPGSGKSTVLARMITLTVPDVRRAMVDAGQPILATEAPPKGFTFAAAIWAGRSSVTEIIDRLRRVLELDDGQELAELSGRPRQPVPPVVAIDAADEADDPGRLATRVLRPLAAAASRGVIRLLVATRRPPEHTSTPHTDLTTALTTPDTITLDLDDAQWLRFGDIADYAELLLAEPVNYLGRTNPYAEAPRERRVLARAIETQARHSFLLAASVARRHTLERTRTDPQAADWLEQFPATIGAALRHEIDTGYGGVAAARWMAILRPLAFAQGTGLSRDRLGERDLWATLATVLSSGRHTITSDDLDDFLNERVATHLVTRIDASGTIFYRFHHESLADQFLDPDSVATQHDRIVELLLDSIRRDPPEWSTAGPYLRRALPGHAQRAGRVNGLVTDPGFVTHCDPDRVFAALRDAEGLPARIRLMLRPLLHRLPRMAPPQRAFLLGVVALSGGSTRGLSPGLAALAGSGTRVPLAAIRSATDHMVLTESPGVVVRVVTTADRYGAPVVLTTARYDVEAWNPEDGVLVERLTPRAAIPMDLLPYTDRDGFPVLAVGQATDEVGVWDVTTRFPITRTPPGRPLGNTLCAGRLEPDRPFLVGSSRRGVALWEPGCDEVTALPIAEGWVTSVATVARRDKSDLVAVACTGGVEVWDPLAMRRVGTLEPPDSLNVRLLGVGEHGTDGVLLLAAGLTDGGLWRVRTSDLTLDQIDTGNEAPTCVAGTVDRAGHVVVAVGLPHGAVLVTPVDPPGPTRILRADGPTIQDVAVLETATAGLVVAAGDQIGRVQAWRARDGEPLLNAIGDGRVDGIALGRFRTGRPYLVSGSASSVRLWDPRHRSNAEDVDHRALHAGEVICLTVFTDSGRRYLATIGSDSTLRVWDAGTGASTVRGSLPADATARLISWQGPDDHPHLAASTSEGLFLIDGTASTGPTQLDLGYAGSLVVLPGHQDRPTLLAVAVGTEVHLVDAARGGMVGVLAVPPDCGSDRPFSRQVTSLASVPSPGGCLAAGTEDGLVSVWSLDDLDSAPVLLPGHEGPVLSLVPPQGQAGVLAVGSRHGSARIWDPATGDLVADCATTAPAFADQWPALDSGFVRWAALPCGLLANVADADQTAAITLWDPTGRPVWHHRYPTRVSPAGHAVGVTSGGQEFLALVRSGGIDLVRVDDAPSLTHLPLPVDVPAIAAVGATVYAAGGGGFVALEVEDLR